MDGQQECAAQVAEDNENNKTANSNKKKRSPNWLPQEEEQLARSWLKVSEQARFNTNQTSETFFKAVEADFNIHSKLHYRDHDQIRIRWAALNTATLKFSAIYNAIEKSPPRNSTPDDWMNAARRIYSQQSRGHSFKDELAWRRLRHAPKWKQDNKKINFQSHSSPDLSIDVQQPQESNQPLAVEQSHQSDRPPDRSESSLATPQDYSPMSNSLIIHNIEGTRSKRLRMEHDLERLISQNNQDDSIQSIPVIPTDPIEPTTTPLKNQTDTNHHHTNNSNYNHDSLVLGSSTMNSMVDTDELTRLKKENLELERDSKRSQIEMNDLKLIMQSESDCPDEESVMLLRLMKSRLKKRLLSHQY